MAELPEMATLRNDSDEPIVMKADGIPYVFKPGKERDVPISIAAFFIGGDLTGTIDASDKRAVEAERLRIAEARPLTPLERMKPPPNPLVLVEITDPNEIIEEVQKKVVKKARKKAEVTEPILEPEPEEVPFSSLEGPSEEADLLAEAMMAKEK